MLLKMRSTRSFAHHFIHYVTTGNLISHYIPVGIPGSIWGLLLLFRFNDSCNSLGVDLFRFELADPIHGSPFVPVSVGIIKYYDLLVSQWKVLLIPNILSTVLTLLVIAFIGNYLFYKQSFTHKRKKYWKDAIFKLTKVLLCSMQFIFIPF